MATSPPVLRFLGPFSVTRDDAPVSLPKSPKCARYDQRGNGLSDWEVESFSLDANVADLEAVVDSAGLHSFPLLGISGGCRVAVEYAARRLGLSCATAPAIPTTPPPARSGAAQIARTPNARQ